ncbi:hypothetical protein [Alteribacillus sp. HJP-4]|uniref:hypothetical protein n=1 Tax=Alteribacillus sp. HJP-4 TaxID=2775394 RepID=UPI0035CCEBE2
MRRLKKASSGRKEVAPGGNEVRKRGNGASLTGNEADKRETGRWSRKAGSHGGNNSLHEA